MSPSAELLADLCLESSLVFAAAWAGTRALRRGSAAARHLVWTASVVAVLLLPVAGVLLPSLGPAALPSWDVGTWHVNPLGVAPAPRSPAHGPVGARTPTSGVADAAPVRLEAETRPPSRSADREGGPRDPGGGAGTDGSGGAGTAARTGGPGAAGVWRAAVPLLWAAGAGAVLLLLALERWRLWRLRRRSRRVRSGRLREETRRMRRRLGVRRGVAVHVGRSSTVPVTWGSLAPRLLLPPEAERWPDERLRAVLLHELAHVRRRDTLTQTLAAVACAVHWFNPLAWMAARHMREERERAADDMVLGAGARQSSYALELVALARSLSGAPVREVTAVSMLRPSLLPDRIEAVLDGTRSRAEPGLGAVSAVLVAGLAGGGLLAAGGPAGPATVPPLETVRKARFAAGPAVGSSGLPARSRDTLPPCWRDDGPRSLDVHTNPRYREVTREDEACTATLRVEGRLEFDRGFSRLVAVPPGGRVVLEERDGAGVRRIEVQGGPGGTPAYEVREDGEVVATGERAGRELRSRLLVLFRYGGVEARRRASWMLDAHGVDGLLAEAGAIPPDPVAADYLDVLLRSRRLSPRQVSDVAETVRRGVGSDRSAGRVLGLLWRTQRESLTGPASASVSRAMSSIGSDAETVRLLSDLARDDPSVAVDGRVERVFWRAAATVGSDAQQAGLLRQVLAEEGVDAALLSRALRSARSGVGSDGVMETLLRWTARRFPDLLTEPGPDEAFRAALATIGSDAGRARVTAAARGVLR